MLLGLVCVLFPALPAPQGAQERVYLALSLALLGLLSVAYAWDTYDLPSLVAGMLGGSERGGGEAVAMAIGPSLRTDLDTSSRRCHTPFSGSACSAWRSCSQEASTRRVP